MKVLCKGDPKFIFFIIFFYNPLIQSQQLALPIKTIAAVGTYLKDQEIFGKLKVTDQEIRDAY